MREKNDDDDDDDEDELETTKGKVEKKIEWVKCMHKEWKREKRGRQRGRVREQE